MNFDERIKQELSEEAEHLDHQLLNDSGLFSMFVNAYKGSLGRWLVMVFIAGTLISVLMVYSGYQFFFVDGDLEFKLNWGVTLIISTMLQISLKMWAFMEMNRQSGLREVKRLELTVEKLIKIIAIDD